MPHHYPDYPSHRLVLDYFQSYAEHFNLIKYIRFNTQVLNAVPINHNQWKIVFENEQGTGEEYFDYLLVANGHHWDPVLPEYPGEFSGQILHSHQYKKASVFKGQRVLVVGGGIPLVILRSK